MSLPSGQWKSNINGIENSMTITETLGKVSGNWMDFGIQGVWDEASQTITFWLTTLLPPADPGIPLSYVFRGALLSIPPNPSPTQDVTLILTGSFLAPPTQPFNPDNPLPLGNERRSEYGWFAQIEVTR